MHQIPEHLIESLGAEDHERIDALWAEEAERRNREIEDGIVKAIPGGEVMQRLRSRYKANRITGHTALE